MEVRLGSSTGPQVVAPLRSIDHFAQETRFRQTQWAQRLLLHEEVNEPWPKLPPPKSP